MDRKWLYFLLGAGAACGTVALVRQQQKGNPQRAALPYEGPSQRHAYQALPPPTRPFTPSRRVAAANSGAPPPPENEFHTEGTLGGERF